MITNIVELTVILLIWVSLIFALVVYYLFYRKHTAELASAFKMLNEHSLIHSDNYLFYEQLGAPGFGYLVSLLAKILKNERYQIAKNRWIEPKASQPKIKKTQLKQPAFYPLI